MNEFIGHNSFDDIPWINRLVEFTKQVLAQDRVRILGICFGHQIVGRALGAKVGRSEQGWEVAVCDMNLTEKGKEVFGQDKIVRDSLLPISNPILTDSLCTTAHPANAPRYRLPLSSQCRVTGLVTALRCPGHVRAAPVHYRSGPSGIQP